MVELRDVHMRFEEKKVLDGVSLKSRAARTSGDHGPERQWQEHDFAIDSRHAASLIPVRFFLSNLKSPRLSSETSTGATAHRYGLSVLSTAEFAKRARQRCVADWKS
jgi:hypothetical protein